MIPIKGCVKNYHWGKAGEDNYIARFLSTAPKTPTTELSKSDPKELNNNTAKACNKNPPLAELWFGSHPSGPSTLIVGDHMIKLDEFLSREPEMVSVIDHYYKYNKQLPFLFKILSIAQPLSLQAHPDKKLAQALHQKDPKNYPDANHKPELAIALTEFHVLCDFRPHAEIVASIDGLPPIKKLINEKTFDEYKSLTHKDPKNDKLRGLLGECFRAVMIGETSSIRDVIENVLSQKYSDVVGKKLRGVIELLNGLYPGDPGVLAPFFLNYLKLNPGQAIYLKANKLHAYLSGECIECMACSDNVVRAGLTTKYRDVRTLIEMLNYEAVTSPHDLILTPKTRQHNDCLIDSFAPTDEFQVEKIVVSNKLEYTLPSVKSASFILVMNGKAAAKDFFDLKTKHKLGTGFSGFVPPKIQLKITDIQGTLVMYRASC